MTIMRLGSLLRAFLGPQPVQAARKPWSSELPYAAFNCGARVTFVLPPGSPLARPPSPVPAANDNGSSRRLSS